MESAQRERICAMSGSDSDSQPIIVIGGRGFSARSKEEEAILVLLRDEHVEYWIMSHLYATGPLACREVRNIPRFFWTTIEQEATNEANPFAAAQIEHARMKCRNIDIKKWKGQRVESIIQSPTNSGTVCVSLKENEEKERIAAAMEAVQFVKERAGKSAGMVCMLEQKPERYDIMVEQVARTLTAQYIRNNVRVLKKFDEEMVKKGVEDPWNAQSGSGPQIENLEDHARVLKGKTSTQSFVTALTWAHDHLYLRLPMIQSLSVIANRNAEKYARPESRASPYSAAAVIFMESVVVGVIGGYNKLTRYFIAIVLVTVYAAKRFKDVVRVPATKVKELAEGLTVYPWKEKRGLETLPIQIPENSYTKYPWRAFLGALMPSEIIECDFAIPGVSNGFTEWDFTSELTTAKASAWLKGFWKSKGAVATVPEAERNEKGRMQAGRRTMPSTLADSGASASVIRTFTGHAVEQTAMRYVESSEIMREETAQRAVKRLRESNNQRNQGGQ